MAHGISHEEKGRSHPCFGDGFGDEGKSGGEGCPYGQTQQTKGGGRLQGGIHEENRWKGNRTKEEAPPYYSPPSEPIAGEAEEGSGDHQREGCQPEHRAYLTLSQPQMGGKVGRGEGFQKAKAHPDEQGHRAGEDGIGIPNPFEERGGTEAQA